MQAYRDGGGISLSSQSVQTKRVAPRNRGIIQGHFISSRIAEYKIIKSSKGFPKTCRFFVKTIGFFWNAFEILRTCPS